MRIRIDHHPNLPLFSPPNKTLSFTFNGKIMQAYEGDTIACALFANGVQITKSEGESSPVLTGR